MSVCQSIRFSLCGDIIQTLAQRGEENNSSEYKTSVCREHYSLLAAPPLNY